MKINFNTRFLKFFEDAKINKNFFPKFRKLILLFHPETVFVARQPGGTVQKVWEKTFLF